MAHEAGVDGETVVMYPTASVSMGNTAVLGSYVSSVQVDPVMGIIP